MRARREEGKTTGENHGSPFHFFHFFLQGSFFCRGRVDTFLFFHFFAGVAPSLRPIAISAGWLVRASDRDIAALSAGKKNSPVLRFLRAMCTCIILSQGQK
jgi:hypothetical protein